MGKDEGGKKRKIQEDSDEGSEDPEEEVASEGDEDDESTKKSTGAKGEAKGGKGEGGSGGKLKLDKDGSSWCKISDGRNQKRLCVQAFKGMTLVHIREYYEKDGEMRPGKGIALTPEQFEMVCGMKDEVMRAVAKDKKK